MMLASIALPLTAHGKWNRTTPRYFQKRIKRLTRSLSYPPAGTIAEIKNIFSQISRMICEGAEAHPAMDTTSAHGRLLLNILGSIAEFERELIKSRTSEDRARAKLRGVKFGRKPKLTADQVREALARWQAGDASVDIGRSYNVSHSKISRPWSSESSNLWSK
jgi:DNA invertase Pin-like site-specific DNA recombinase